MPLVRGGRPLKRWSYVGAYGPDLMLCAATGRIGVIPFSWWAVWDGERLREGRGRGLDVDIEGGAEIEVVSPHGSQYAWTRKREARARFQAHDLRGIVDQSAGYHARHTVVALVGGRRDARLRRAGRLEPRRGDPRCARGVGAHGVGRRRAARGRRPSPFDGLRGVGGLRFEPVAVARRGARTYLLVRSDYEQPFGIFTGELPGAGRLREGWGVMERHEVMW